MKVSCSRDFPCGPHLIKGEQKSDRCRIHPNPGWVVKTCRYCGRKWYVHVRMSQDGTALVGTWYPYTEDFIITDEDTMINVTRQRRAERNVLLENGGELEKVTRPGRLRTRVVIQSVDSSG
jgi:hypothetical protein